MFKSIFLFELKYRAGRLATYIYFLLYLLIGMLYGSIMYGVWGEQATIAISGGEQLYPNAPFNIFALVAGMGQLGVFAIAAIMGVPIYRDFEHKTHSLFFTKPISKFGYIGGRFLGSLVVTYLVLLSIPLGMILALALPNIKPEILAPFNLYYYFHPFLVNIVPVTLFMSTIFFTTVSLTRNQLFIYLNAITVLVLLSVASSFTSQLDNEYLGGILDPTGNTAIQNATKNWTTAQKNTTLFSPGPIYLANQALWLALAFVLMAFTYFKLSFNYQAPVFVLRRRAGSTLKMIADSVSTKKIVLPKVKQDFSFAKSLSLLWHLVKKEFLGILKNPIFIAITVVGVLFMFLNVLFSGQVYETPTLPVTYRILDVASGSFFIFFIILIVFYSGEVVWKERGEKVNMMFDALPIPSWVIFISKLLGLFLVLYFLMAIVMLTGMLIQTFQGYFKYEIGLYLQSLFVFRIWSLLIFCTFAFFVQVIVNNKYLGFFITILGFALFNIALPLLGVENRLFLFNSTGGTFYSDMNRFGDLSRYFTLSAYWTAFAGILLVLASVFWLRGTDTAPKSRLQNAKTSLKGVSVAILIFCIIAFVSLGSFIYYNIQVLNEFQHSKDIQKTLAEYEKKYKKYDGIAQPRITGINLNVDLFPKKQAMKAKGTYILKNKTEESISTVHVLLLNDPKKIKYSFDKKIKKERKDKKFNYYIFELEKPLKPKEEVELKFELEFEQKGFTNSGTNTSVIKNGTFFNNMSYFPKIGYQDAVELTRTEIRKKFALPPKARVPSIDDEEALQNNAISSDSDWIDFEVVVSTSPEQIAIAPGYLQKEWIKKGRRYFHYKMDAPILNFYSILSADYEVKKSSWENKKGEKVAIEIYYHKPHKRNLDRMIKSIQKSFDYYSENFSPYQFRQARIIEFPRYASFAQSFPNTIPYSEGLGFIADIDEGQNDIDYVFYVTAHEIAHQWWAHQVIPANTQGATAIVESMAQYGALMVMEKEYGQNQMKKFLKLELDKYLRGRSTEFRSESPLLLVEGQQYIHYNKGSLVLYAMKDYIGEEKLNKAMQDYIKAVRFQEPPYTTAKEWVGYIRKATPDSLQYLIKDLFETITLYDNKLEKVSYQKKGKKYEVTLKLKPKKYRVDGLGNEKAIKFVDYVDIGIFVRKEGKDKTLYLRKHKITPKTKTLKILVDEKPSSASIDPFYKLIDKRPNDNGKRF